MENIGNKMHLIVLCGVVVNDIAVVTHRPPRTPSNRFINALYEV